MFEEPGLRDQKLQSQESAVICASIRNTCAEFLGKILLFPIAPDTTKSTIHF